MGVKGLQYFIDNYCPSVMRRVSISEMAQENARIFHSPPIIAIDGMSVLNRLYKMDDLEWLYGGQWKEYLENLGVFVNHFKQAGIQPIFFFDGLVKDEKKREWIDRRTEKLKDVKKIFEHLVEHGTYPDERLSQLPTSFATLIRYALPTRLKCKVINTIDDVDREITSFASQTDSCFAILSQDTDFVIFQTKPYLSVAHLKLATLETIEYDRPTFAAHIGIDINYLPMLACLLGNDCVHVDTVRAMHKMFTGTSENPPVHLVIPHLVSFISTEYSVSPHLVKNHPMMAQKIAVKLCIDAEELLKGIQYYTVISTPDFYKPLPKTTTMEQLYQIHRKGHINPQILALLTQLSYKSSECLEDQRSTGLMPSSIIFRGLRQRLYAIMFGMKNVEVEELSAIQGMPVLIEKVKPEYFLVFGAPPPDVGQLRDHTSIRWKTVAAAMGMEGINFSLNGAPAHFLAFACIINYLLRNPVGDPPLRLWEVEALVAQTVCPLANDLQGVRNLQVPVIEPRAIHLATIIIRGLTTFISLLQMCFEPIAVWKIMPWFFFNGKLFHYLYLMAKAGATPIQLVLNDWNAMREFKVLRTMAIAGTPLVKELAQRSSS